jgi:hypothetical protein
MKYVAVLLLLGIALAVVMIWRPQGEPSYHGHRLGYWVDMYGNSYPDRRDPEDMEALHVIGTNALPYLINWVHGADGKRAMCSAVTFKVLGTNAIPAIPVLKAILANPTNGYACVLAQRALTRIGSDGFAAVLEAIATPRPDRGDLIQGDMLTPYIARPSEMPPGQADPNYKINSKRAVPFLLKCLEDHDSFVQDHAVMLLSTSDPDSVVPALTNFIQGSPPQETRRLAIAALRAYGKISPAVVPFLSSRLNDPDPTIREETTNALKTITSESLGLP